MLVQQKITFLRLLKIGFIILSSFNFYFIYINAKPEAIESGYYGCIDEDGYLNEITYEYDSYEDKWFIKIFKVNKNGQIVFEKVFNYSYKESISTTLGNIYAVKDYDYVFTKIEENPYRLYLIVTKNNCSEINEILLANKTIDNLDIIVRNNGEFYVKGTFLNNTGYYSYLSNLDLNGDIKWKKCYKQNSRASCITKIYEENNNIMYSMNNIIYKRDENGNPIIKYDIEKYIGEDKSIRDFIILSDNNILTFYTDKKDYWSISKPNIIKIDSKGNELWKREYNYDKYEIYTYGNYNLFETVEGGFFFVLKTGLAQDEPVSIKCEINGNIEWDIEDNILYQDKEGYYYSYRYKYEPDYPYLTINSPYGSKIGEGRYKLDSSITFGINPEYIEYNNTKATFVKWVTKNPKGYNGTDNLVNMKIESNLIENAVWDIQYYIDFNCKNGELNVSDGWFNHNESIIIEASALGNYEFVGWEISSDQSDSTNGTILNIVVNTPSVVSALFRENVRYLDIQSEYGEVTGEGKYQTGEIISFKVSPSVTYGNTRHIFQSWVSYDDSGYSGSNNPVEIHLESNVTQIANWKTQYYVEIISEDGGSIPEYTDWYNNGSILSISATSNSGYSFDEWIDEESGISYNEPSIEIEIDRPYRLVAKFSKEQNEIPSYSSISIMIGIIVFYLFLLIRKRNKYSTVRTRTLIQ